MKSAKLASEILKALPLNHGNALDSLELSHSINESRGSIAAMLSILYQINLVDREKVGRKYNYWKTPQEAAENSFHQEQIANLIADKAKLVARLEETERFIDIIEKILDLT